MGSEKGRRAESFRDGTERDREDRRTEKMEEEDKPEPHGLQ